MQYEVQGPKDHPMLIAWEKYKTTEEYTNSFKWAANELHRSGSMWAAFMAGWESARLLTTAVKMEPTITINGVPLTEGQSMTLRVAASNFAMELQQTGLGDDEHGKAMTIGYLARLNEILELMANSKVSRDER